MFANDSDIGLNGLVTYELMNHKDKFRIDAFTGSISTKSGIIVSDVENIVYDLSVVASDRGRPALRYLNHMNKFATAEIDFLNTGIMYFPACYKSLVYINRSMANVAITVRRKIIKGMEISLNGADEGTEENTVAKQISSIDESGETSIGQQRSPQETFPGTTGVARPFVDDKSSSTSFGTSPKNVPSSLDVINPNLFKEKAVNLEMYENIRAPSKILDLRSLLMNENADNVIFELMENKHEMFEVDQLSGNIYVYF